MVGFNRRFAPLIVELKNRIPPNIPLAINYRINAGVIPKEHWIQDKKFGGGRVLGEVCHFIDLCGFLAESKVVALSAITMKDVSNLGDTLAINLLYDNGGIAHISYFSNGNKNLPKESIEVFGGGVVSVLENFITMWVLILKSLNLKMRKQFAFTFPSSLKKMEA